MIVTTFSDVEDCNAYRWKENSISFPTICITSDNDVKIMIRKFEINKSRWSIGNRLTSICSSSANMKRFDKFSFDLSLHVFHSIHLFIISFFFIFICFHDINKFNNVQNEHKSKTCGKYKQSISKTIRINQYPCNC